MFQPDVLEMLVQNGANLHARTKNQETPYGETFFSKLMSRSLKI